MNRQIPKSIQRYAKTFAIKQKIAQIQNDQFEKLQKTDPDTLKAYVKTRANEINKEVDRQFLNKAKDDPIWDDAKNALRATVQRINQGKVSNALSTIDENTQRLEDINKISRYNELVDLLKSTSERLFNEDLDEKTKKDLQQQWDSYNNEIQQLEQFFKTDGRNSPVIRRLMYNPEKLNGIYDNTRLGIESLTDGMHKVEDFGWNPISGIIKAAENAGTLVQNLVTLGANAIGKAGVNKIEKLMFNTDPSDYATTDRLIETLPQDDPLIAKLLKSRQESLADAQKTSEKLASWKKWYEGDNERQMDELKTQYDNLTKGNLSFHILGANLGTWDVSDPEDISESFKAGQKANQGDWMHPLYNLPEIGSTIQLMQNQLYTMGTAGVVKYLMKNVPSLAVGLPKYALMAAETGVALYNARQSRRNETAQEAIDALGQRMANICQTEGSDLEKVYSKILEHVEKNTEGGKDSAFYKQMQGAEISDVLQYGIANNIKTGDAVYDEALPNIHKGIQTLINQNNSLAYTDYLETLPFMSYSGNVLKSFTKTLGKGITTAGKYTSGAFGKYGAAGERLFTGIEQRAAHAAMLGEKFSYSSFPELSRVIDHSVLKASQKLYEMSPKLAFGAGRLGQVVKTYGKIMLPTMFIESSEEGVQHLLQQRFVRGEYDDVQVPTNTFALPDVFENMNLTKQAWSAYLGVNFGDPDNGSKELRNAMNIGAMMATIIPLGGSAVKSILPSSLTNIDGGLGTLVNQLRSDNAILNLIGENYGANEDDNHIAIFYDALRRKGINSQKLIQSLSDMKRFIGQEGSQLVTNDYIDRDIRAVLHVDAAMNSKALNEALSDLGIEKNSEQHKELIQLYVSHSLGAETIARSIREGEQKLNDLISNRNDIIEEYLDPNTPESRKQQLQTDYSEITTMVDRIIGGRSESTRRAKDKAKESAENESARLIQELTRLNELDENDSERILGKQKIFDQLLRNDEVKNALSGYVDKEGKLEDLILNGDTELLNKIELSRYDLLNRSNKEYVATHFVHMNMYAQQLRARQMLQNAKEREWLLTNMQRVTGLDINTDKIKGVVKAIERQLDQLKKYETALYENINKNRADKVDFDVLFGEYKDWLNGQKEINDQIDEIILNTAASTTENAMAKLYRALDLSAPFINELVYGDANAESELQKESKDYTELLNNIAVLPRLERDPATMRDMKSISRTAAIKAIKKELAEKENRKRIMHKQMLEDGEVNESTVQDAFNGDEDAANSLVGASAEEQATMTTQDANNGTKLSFETESVRNERLRIEGEDVTIGKAPTRSPLSAKDDVEPIVPVVLDETDQEIDPIDRVTIQNIDLIESGAISIPKTEYSIEPQNGVVVPFFSKEQFGDYSFAVELFSRGVLQEEGSVVWSFVDPINPDITYYIRTKNKTVGEFGTSVEFEAVYRDPETGELSTLNLAINTEIQNVPSSQFVVANSNVEDPSYPLLSFSAGQEEEPIIYDTEKQLEVSEIPQEQIIQQDETSVQNQEQTKEDLERKKEEERQKTDKAILNAELQHTREQEEQSQTLDPVQIGEIESADEQNASENQIQNSIEEAVKNAEQAKKQVNNDINEMITIKDLKKLDIVNGILYYDGMRLPDAMAADLELELKLMSALDVSFGSLDQSQLPFVSNNQTHDKSKEFDPNRLRQYVSQTFFYSIDPAVNNTPIKLTIGGQQVQLEHELRPARDLAKKLVEKDWFKNAKKYYVVTQSEQDAEMTANDPDNFTVSLIIDDGQYSYATVLRKLGQNISRNEAGRVFDNAKSHEQKVRQDLERIGTDTYGLTGEEYETKKFHARQEAAEGLYKAEHAVSDKQPVISDFNTQDEYLIALGEWKNRVRDWYTKAPERNQFNTDAEYENAKEKWRRISSLVHQLSIQAMARIGQTPMTEAQIDAEINALRKLRMSIIEASVQKDVSGRYVFSHEHFNKMLGKVTPVTVTSSNGRIDSQRDGMQPVFRTVSSGNAEQITKDIEDAKLQLGLGLGVRGSERWLIRGLKPNTSVQYNGRGIGGKIYWMANGLNGGSVPIMLSETKFNTQSRIVKGKENKKAIGNDVSANLKLCIDPITGKVINDLQGYKPSAAEVILYLVTGKLSIDHIPGGNAQTIRSFGDLFVHCDESTLLNDKGDVRELGRIFKPYAAKQFAYHNNGSRMVLTIGIKEGDSYVAKDFTDEMLFGENSEDNRRLVVNAIASQIHWNTDELAMGSTFDGNEARYVTDVIDALRSHFQSTGDNEVSICDIPEFTFKFDDFFDDQYNTKHVSVAGWMLSNGKLMTDASENVFRDPFVFANGVNIENVQKVLQDVPKTKEGVSDVKEALIQNVDDILNRMHKIRGLQKLQVVDSEGRQAVLDYFNSTSIAQEKGGVLEVIALDPTNLKSEANVKEKMNKYVEKYNASHDVKIDKNNIDYPALTGKLPLLLKKQGLPLVTVFADGSAKVKIINIAGSTDIKNIQNGVTAVFQKVKSKGRFKEKNAKKWLYNKLGISDENVIVRNGILRSMTGEQYFGALMLATDRITDAITAQMMFSRDTSGKGTHYHEAWHYVNLLLHSPEVGMALYDEFIQAHPNLEYSTYLDVEEAMAEDFREYMEMRNSWNPVNLVKRFYNDVLDLCVATRRKSAYRAVYKDIRKGRYKLDKFNNKSLDEFIEKHPEGIWQQFSIDGFSEKELENLEHIDSYQQFYDTTEAAIDYLFDSFAIDSVKKMRWLSGKGMTDVLEDLKSFAEEQEDPAQRDQIMDLIKNPKVLQHAIVEEFTKYGIRAKIRSFKQTDLDEVHNLEELDQKRQEEEGDGSNLNPPTEEKDETDLNFDNVWDRFDLSLSKKDQASFNARLFFRRIPIKQDVFLEDGSIVTIDQLNDFGNQKLHDADVAWKTILRELWSCDSFEDVDERGEYKKNSIKGRVNELSRSNNFFLSMKEKLEELEERGDIQTKSQIWSAIASSKPNVSYFTISDPVVYAKRNLLMMETQQDPTVYDTSKKIGYGDRERSITMFDDNRFAITQSLPRQWSKNILFKGITEIQDGMQVVSETYGLLLQNKLNDIRQIIKSVNQKNELDVTNALYGNEQYLSENQQLFEFVADGKYINKQTKNVVNVHPGLKQMMIDLYNAMGIPVDEASLDVYITTTILETDKNLSNKDVNAQTQFVAIKKLMNSNSSGSIGHFVDTVVNSAGQTMLHPKKGEEKPIGELYNRYKRTSKYGYPDISKLALSINQIHPSPEEFQVRLPNGDMAYPISNNNHRSNVTRRLCNEGGDDVNSSFASKLARSKYCRHTKLLSAAQTLGENSMRDDQLKMNTFVGWKDSNSMDGEDYFGISILEEVLSKMFYLENDHLTATEKKYGIVKAAHLVPPIQADKKTYNTISSTRFRNFHDPIIYAIQDPQVDLNLNNWYWENIEPFPSDRDARHEAIKRKNAFINDAENKEIVDQIKQQSLSEYIAPRTPYIQRFQNSTLQYFVNQVLDEIDYLLDYYSESNIKFLVENESERIKNLHGSVEYDNELKQNRMQFGGNGGLFRYFYEIEMYTDPNTGYRYNMNQRMQMLWNMQHAIETGKAKSDQFDGQTIGSGVLSGDVSTRDGFEMIREYLQNLRTQLFPVNQETGRIVTHPDMLNRMNDFLIEIVNEQVVKFCDPESQYQLGFYSKEQGLYLPYSVPEQMLQKYVDDFEELGLSYGGKAYSVSPQDQANAFYSLIASFAVNNIVSVIEDEKVFSGDPALFKYQDKTSVSITDTFAFDGSNETSTMTFEIDEVHDLFSDKIKRLGSTNSPGELVRLSYSDEEIESIKDGETLRCPLYTNLNIQDIEAESVVYEDNKSKIRKQVLIDVIRTNQLDVVDKIIENLKQNAKDDNAARRINKEYVAGLIYSDAKYLNGEKTIEDEIRAALPHETVQLIDDLVKQKTNPYGKNKRGIGNINVSDAQVIIRPQLYRKIRLGLGQWSTVPDENGYCDEDAYWILQNNADWMNDPELAAKVSKLQLYPLKMSYYQNDPTKIGEMDINMAILNKMAIFPWFKYQASSDIGLEIYDRMNKEGQELDMISFLSAVKIGAKQKAISIFDKKASANETLSKLATDEAGEPLLRRKSSVHIDYKTSTEKQTLGKDVLPVTVQNIGNLVMQLNTKAHTDEERSLGSQMFKLAMSGVIKDAQFCVGKAGRKVRSGGQIQEDIMGCIDALSQIGSNDIDRRYYVQEHDEEIEVKDKETGEVTKKTKHVGKHLNDNAVVKFVNSVIRNNNLGPAAQEIIHHGGVVASLLSRQVFEQTAATAVNKAVVDINTHGGTAIQQSIFGFNASALGNAKVSTQGIEGGILTDNNGKTTVTHSYHQYNMGQELKWCLDDNSMEVMVSLNYFIPVVPEQYQTDYETMRQWLVDHDIIKGIKSDGTVSKPKPFGIGYRIPTQGLSSMFAFVVADVLPKNSGDLIVVPREFTAQTGSDFDVDKLYLATMSYHNGVMDQFSNEDLNNWKSISRGDLIRNIVEDENVDVDKYGAVSNRLLWNYIDLITDRQNYDAARSSIDTATGMVTSILPMLRSKQVGYFRACRQATPTFQADKKLEFCSGKDGVAAMALAVTNTALTQYTGLTLEYDQQDQEHYNFGDLHEIYSQGKIPIRVADWLSAMVNAHVDVAKDPYVFDINVNKFTYNHTTFLIRAGKGLSTFTFLAQPILKAYANTMNNSGGIYGKNIDGREYAKSNYKKASDTRKRLADKYLSEIKLIFDQIKDQLSEDELSNATLNISYFDNKYSDFKKKKKNKQNDQKNDNLDLAWNYDVFNQEQALRYIQILNGNIDGNAVDRFNAMMFQLYALEAFQTISKYATKLEQLVQESRVDTKKFGKTIQEQIDYVNKYEIFKNTSTGWKINGIEKPKKEIITYDENGKQHKKTVVDESFPLTHYFTKTFLDDKLKKATFFTKDLLKHQTFTATDQYKNLYIAINQIIKGDASYTDFNGHVHHAYNPIGNRDTFREIGLALDNIIRYTMFNQYGPVAYKAYKNADEVNAEGPIDYTMGGNIEDVINKLKLLQFGIGHPKGLTLFQRLNNFTDYIRTNTNSSQADGLINPVTGQIQNDLLLYLQPQNADSRNPIGRLQLQTSQMQMKEHQKSRLRSAFHQLLTHEDQSVRRLARDLAFYAYYSTYDQNTYNSFFDLVPVTYRMQYDDALSRTLHMKNRGRNELLIGSQYLGNGSLKEHSFFDLITSSDINTARQFVDLIARNYWYNNDIVPIQKFNKFQNSFLKPGSIKFGNYNDRNAKQSFPGAIVSTNISGPYFKIVQNGVTYLYRKVGDMTRKVPGKNKDWVNDKNGQFGVYVVTQKLGIHSGGIHQYELYAKFGVPSIYEENKLPNNFNPSLLLEEIKTKAESESTDKVMFEFSYGGTETMPQTYSQENEDVYFQAVRKSITNQNGTIVVNTQSSNPVRSASNAAQCIIRFDSSNTDQEFESKTVNATTFQDIDQVISSVSEITKSKQMLEEDVNVAKRGSKNVSGVQSVPRYVYNSGISLYITGSVEEIKVTDDDLRRYKQSMIDQLKEELINANATPEEIEECISSVENASDQMNRDAAAQTKLNEYINNLIQQMLLNGIKINQIFMTNDGPITKAVANAINLNSGSFYNSMSNILYLNDDVYKQEGGFDVVMSDISAIDLLSTDPNERSEFKQSIDNVNALYDDIYKTISDIKDDLKKLKTEQEEAQLVEQAKIEQAKKEETENKTSTRKSLKSRLSQASAEENAEIGEQNPKSKLNKLRQAGAEDVANTDIAKQASKNKQINNC